MDSKYLPINGIQRYSLVIIVVQDLTDKIRVGLFPFATIHIEVRDWKWLVAQFPCNASHCTDWHIPSGAHVIAKNRAGTHDEPDGYGLIWQPVHGLRVLTFVNTQCTFHVLAS